MENLMEGFRIGFTLMLKNLDGSVRRFIAELIETK
jgi:hypothetical protein